MHLERCLEIFSLNSIHALHFCGHRCTGYLKHPFRK
jgi:hypothetical protein